MINTKIDAVNEAFLRAKEAGYRPFGTYTSNACANPEPIKPLSLEELLEVIAALKEQMRQSFLSKIVHGPATEVRLLERFKQEGFHLIKELLSPTVAADVLALSNNGYSRLHGVPVETDSRLPKDEIRFLDQFGQVMNGYKIGVDLSLSEV